MLTDPDHDEANGWPQVVVHPVLPSPSRSTTNHQPRYWHNFVSTSTAGSRTQSSSCLTSPLLFRIAVAYPVFVVIDVKLSSSPFNPLGMVRKDAARRGGHRLPSPRPPSRTSVMRISAASKGFACGGTCWSRWRGTPRQGGCPLGSLGGQLAESDPEARAHAAGFEVGDRAQRWAPNALCRRAAPFRHRPRRSLRCVARHDPRGARPGPTQRSTRPFETAVMASPWETYPPAGISWCGRHGPQRVSAQLV